MPENCPVFISMNLERERERMALKSAAGLLISNHDKKKVVQTFGVVEHIRGDFFGTLLLLLMMLLRRDTSSLLLLCCPNPAANQPARSGTETDDEQKELLAP